MITVGAASRVINGEIGAHIQAATHQQRARSIRDDLEANALFLSNADTRMLLVSCDLVGLEIGFVAQVRQAMAEATGLTPRSILLGCTHTHSGPSLIPTSYGKPVATHYLARLQGWLVELSQEAVHTARPGAVGWGIGLAQIGYNRRCCWADGSHTMHGDTGRADFTGLEGPEDASHLALFAEDHAGELVAVLHTNTSHPTCFYGADFYSADFPGTARDYLREALGSIPVLFFNGALGDISITDQLAPKPHAETPPQTVSRAALLVAGETLRILHHAQFHENLLLGHAYEELQLSVRLPKAERLSWARRMLARLDAGHDVDPWDSLVAHGTSLLHERYSQEPVDTVAVHALRLGEVGLVMQPCELYCQFGIDIKRRSPAAATAVCSLVDGYGGYAPTFPAILGGGYSAEPLYWCRLSAEAGYQIVDTAARLLHRLWSDRSPA